VKIRKLAQLRRENKCFRWLVELCQEVFIMLLVTYLLLLLVETIWEGSVSPHLNLNYLLIVVIALGVIVVVTMPERVEEEKRQLGRKDIIMAVCAALAGAAIVWYKTKEIGWVSCLISAISGVLIVLLSLLIMRGEDADSG